MKEAALSAAALMGLMGFAAYYNHASSGESRAKRAALIVEEFEEPESQAQSDFENVSESELMRFLEELEMVGDAEITGEEDVQNRANVRVNFRKIQRNKFGNKDWNAAFKRAHSQRYNALSSFVEFNEYAYPQAESSVGTEEAPGTPTSTYDGFGATHPKIAGVLSEGTIAATIDEGALFQEGNAILGFVLPNTVPLSSEVGENLADFSKMWTMITKFKPFLDAYRGRTTSVLTPKVIIGRASNKITWQSRSPVRYDRRRFPWTRYQSYNARPIMQGIQPYDIRTAQDIRSMVEAHAATPSADKDCFVMWIHQEVGVDLNQLVLPETQEMLMDLSTLCTILNVFVGYEEYDPVIQAYAAALNPGLQVRAPLDNDFSGVWITKSYDTLYSDEFMGSLVKYMTIIKHRAGCRCADRIYAPAVTDPPPTGVAGDLTAQATDASLDITTAVSDGFDRELTATPSVAGVLEAATGEPRESVLDSCCGADFFMSSAYDSELRTCCENGQVKSWAADGSDPCPLF